MNKQQMLLVNRYESEILELIDNADKFTRSDLQGAVMAIVMSILRNKSVDTSTSQAAFVTKLEERVKGIHEVRDNMEFNSTYERIAYGEQMGLLYVIDQLKHVVTITT